MLQQWSVKKRRIRVLRYGSGTLVAGARRVYLLRFAPTLHGTGAALQPVVFLVQRMRLGHRFAKVRAHDTSGGIAGLLIEWFSAVLARLQRATAAAATAGVGCVRSFRTAAVKLRKAVTARWASNDDRLTAREWTAKREACSECSGPWCACTLLTEDDSGKK